MTSGAVLSLASDAAPAPARDARMARVVEFLVVGGGTLILFPIAWLARAVLGLDTSEYAVGFATFYAAYVINDPHFSVTYLLFYRDVKERARSPRVPLAQRIRYVVAGFVVPLVLAAWGIAAFATHSAQTLGWMVQLMYLLVGWHYAKQGFGVLTVLAARRGTSFTARERTVVLFHCFAAWAFAWANPAAAAGEFEEKGVVYWAPSRPHVLELACGAVLAVSTVLLVATLVARWRRDRRSLPVTPLAGFLVTIWSWTIWSSVDPLVRYVIPALHSIQYFYFVWLMKRNEARSQEGPPTFGRPAPVRLAILAASAIALAWLLFRGVPGFLDAALVAHGRHRRGFDPLGETPFVAAFYVFVNVHHYFMDHVIWRRENPDTRFLRDRA